MRSVQPFLLLPSFERANTMVCRGVQGGAGSRLFSELKGLPACGRCRRSWLRTWIWQVVEVPAFRYFCPSRPEANTRSPVLAIMWCRQSPDRREFSIHGC
jgi:hypothetical protein